MHSPFNRDRHGAQLAALRHNDVQEAPPEAGYRLRGLVQAAAVIITRGPRNSLLALVRSSVWQPICTWSRETPT